MIKKGRLNFSDDLLFWSGFGNCGGKVWADFAFVEDNRYVYQALEFDGGRQSVAVEGVDGFFPYPFLCVDFGLESLQSYGAFGRDVGAANG